MTVCADFQSLEPVQSQVQLAFQTLTGNKKNFFLLCRLIRVSFAGELGRACSAL